VVDLESYKFPNDKVIGPVCILHGDEVFLVDKALSELVSCYLSPEQQTINLSYLDGKVATIEDLESCCETLPFLSEKRITVLKNPGQFIERESRDDRILNYLMKLGTHQILIIYDPENSIKKNTRLFKQLDKKGAAFEFNKLKQSELIVWIQELLLSLGKKMSVSDLNYLVQQSGYMSRNSVTNLFDMENEIRKLTAYSSAQNITRSDVDRVMVRNLDNNIFDLLNAISRKDTGRALELFDEMQIMNEPVQRLLFMISRQFRLLLGYHSYKNKGYGPSEIQNKLQIKPYEYTRISSQAQQFDERYLGRILEIVLETDRRMKTMPVDGRLEMEMLLVEVTDKK
jgi:DNA polymerase-3 subunit delta